MKQAFPYSAAKRRSIAGAIYNGGTGMSLADAFSVAPLVPPPFVAAGGVALDRAAFSILFEIKGDAGLLCEGCDSTTPTKKTVFGFLCEACHRDAVRCDESDRA